MVKVMYDDQLVYKVVIWAFYGISLWTENVVLTFTVTKHEVRIFHLELITPQLEKDCWWHSNVVYYILIIASPAQVDGSTIINSLLRYTYCMLTKLATHSPN